MLKVIQFVVTYNDRLVSVRWLTPFEKSHFGMLRDLEESLEAIAGVESVVMKKYSATLEIADHVNTPAHVAEEVRELLAEDPNMLAHYRFHFHGALPDVVVVPNLVLL